MRPKMQFKLDGRDGPGLDTLFVTPMRPEGIDVSDQPPAGGIFASRCGVRGLA